MNKNNFHQREDQIIHTANHIISGDLNPIEGIRKISRLILYIDNPNNEIFFPLRAIESQTDFYPLNEVRNEFNEEYLKKLDEQLENLLQDEMSIIIESCINIVEYYENR